MDPSSTTETSKAEPLRDSDSVPALKQEIQALQNKVQELQAELQEARQAPPQPPPNAITQTLYYCFQSLHDFLHARTGVQGCRLAGYIRIAYATLFVYSRSWLAYDLKFLMDPIEGVMPYRATKYMLEGDLTIFQWFPHSPEVLYGLMAMGLLHGILLLLGVFPKVQLVGVYFFLFNMYHHNQQIVDHQDIMLRLWAFMLFLLPLDHITIFDLFSKTKTNQDGSTKPQAIVSTNKSQSWPMWPFRVWQIYTCLVYMGAALGKAIEPCWHDGTAMLYVSYETGFGGPDFIFNRLWGIKLVTWSALVLEVACFITIWPLATRKWTFVAVVLLHVGIEMTMAMHIFQYLSVVGWFVFFVYPNDGKTETTTATTTKTLPTSPTFLSPFQRLWHSIVAMTLISLFVVDSLPTMVYPDLAPEFMHPFLETYLHRPIEWARHKVQDPLQQVELSGGVWNLFWGVPTHRNHRYTAVVQFHKQDNDESSNNASQPTAVLWEDPDYTTTGVWKDAFIYYLWDQIEESPKDAFPVLVTFMEYLARIHSAEGAIAYDTEKERLMIHPNNTVASISLLVHWERGTPPREDLGLFEPARGPMVKGSECMYVFELPPKTAESLYLEMEYPYDDDVPYGVQSGCFEYNAEADDPLHYANKPKTERSDWYDGPYAYKQYLWQKEHYYDEDEEEEDGYEYEYEYVDAEEGPSSDEETCRSENNESCIVDWEEDNKNDSPEADSQQLGSTGTSD